MREWHGYLSTFPQLAGYEVGEWSRGHSSLRVLSPEGGDLRVGNFTSIARNVTILLGGEHRTDWITTYPFPAYVDVELETPDYSLTRGDVVIGNDVWIGVNVTILSGLTIGNGAVVGAGSVVQRSIPPYAIALGNPDRPVRYRFDDKTIQALNEIAWWNWPIEHIRAALPILLSGQVEDFIRAAGRTGQGEC